MRKISPAAGWFLFVVLALVPAAYLLYLEASLFAFNFTYLMRLVGRLSALFGMSLFALAFLLSTRLPFLEGLFGGFDRVFAAHRAFGTVAFVSLLVHPLALASTYLVASVAAAARFLLPIGDFYVSLGIFSLLSMELFLIFTFFARVKHQKWKFVHRLLGASFLLGSLHVLLAPGSTMADPVIRGYTALMILVGSASYTYRTLLWRQLVRLHPYRIDAVRPIGSAITELELSPEVEPMRFRPGQFVFISLDSAVANNEPHPFTISSSPSERLLRLSIKSLGDFTADLRDVKPGTRVKLEGPYGSFCSSCEKDEVWIAGGIGVTPFLSMARSMDANTVKRVDLYYCASSREEAVYLEELNEICSRNRNFRVIPFFSSERGRLTCKQVSEECRDLRAREVLICGPAPMMHSLRSQLRGMGLPGRSIRTEEFGL